MLILSPNSAMTLHFSNDGPEFPGDLVDSFLAGEAVFLCGTGVSAPQIPGFESLVDRTYESLAVQKTPSEEHAHKQERYEEVLGSLSRRLADPNAVTHTVSGLLSVPDHPSLDQHRTILRLSRDLENRLAVVTTNFDTLIERAATLVVPDISPVDISFAGQALPAPGGPAFFGVIHIHGRLEDRAIGLEQTPLVLTSADYGDAYMRSAWASRFLFDLARCKTIVLVGYSANDAPVRYFLNVLEADRARFPDLKPVYALDAYEHDPEEAAVSWGTLAVTPLPYCKVNADTGQRDHSPLWRDLEALADFVERPKRSRRERARVVLQESFSNTGAVAREELSWLFGGRRDLWSVLLDAVTDPAWFDFFQNEKLWSIQDGAWVIASWIARDFEDRSRLRCACEWLRRLGPPFTEKIEQQLRQAQGLTESWTRIWRIFCLAMPVQSHNPDYFWIRQRIESGVILDSDLHAAVTLLSPVLDLNARLVPDQREEDDDQATEKLSDIVWPRMAIADKSAATELVDLLRTLPDRAMRILELATQQLQSALELEVDLEMITDEYDRNDSTVPSIENHAQNQYREGVSFLVRVIVDTLSLVPDSNLDDARRIVAGWQRLPGRIGIRLCFHAMRNPDMFDADDAMSALLSVSARDFWTIRRETALLLKERAEAASPDLLVQVETRILETADSHFDCNQMTQDEADWRSHARDAAVWLRLHMLREAGVLSENGVAELNAINERRDYLNRPVEDRDFFGSYSSGIRQIVGDPIKIIEAPVDDRLRVAHELVQGPARELQQGWSEFCRSDPQAAFDSLSGGELTPENAVLWSEFLAGLAFGDEQSTTIRHELSVQALEHLAEIDADALLPMLTSLCDVIRFGPRDRIDDVDAWLDRLWDAMSLQPEETTDLAFDSPNDLYEHAINSPAGRLTEALLLEIGTRRNEGSDPTANQLELLSRICAFDGTCGRLGRLLFARDVAFLLSVDPTFTEETLRPYMDSSDSEGAALRAVMLTYGSITPEVSQVFADAIKTGVEESLSTEYHASAVAANILRPALTIAGDEAPEWGLSAADVSQLLRAAPQAIRTGVLDMLSRWLRSSETGVESGWREMVAPFFERVWPKERKFRDASLTPHLIDLAAGSGNEFPAALDALRPYISPYDQGHGSLHGIASSDAPERFPRATLDLLWLVCGPNSDGSFYELPNIIDRLIEVDPNIEIDRRLQWLEQHARRLY